MANQLSNMGVQVPGFRSSKVQFKRILNKYIPTITVLGGAFVGLLAFAADLTGALGGGTGVLLTVGVVYKLYEEIAKELIILGFVNEFREELPMEYAVELNRLLQTNINTI